LQFLYNENAKNETISIEKDEFKYLFRVKRHQLNDLIYLKNSNDLKIYLYKVVDISKREALLELVESKEVSQNLEFLELAWSVVDVKTIEKTLPSLNEIGVSKISFIYSDRSQRNFKINIDRLHKIVKNSNQQCGRFDFMQFEIFESIDSFLEQRDNIAYLNFGGDLNLENIKTILIGSEGGFTDRELDILKNHKKVGLKSDLILKSESASIAICSKILL